MRKVELGNTGELISCIGLGTMYFGSRLGEKTSFALLDQYAGYGGSFLDSANKYASWVPGCQGGESERTIGRWMKERGNRQDMFVTSKAGFQYAGIPRSLKREVIISECEKSLERLGLETIDLYFAHAFDPETPIEETMDAFYQLKKSGKIRFAGASNFMTWRLTGANHAANRTGWEGFCCIQQRHTFLEPTLRADFGNQLTLTPGMEDYCSCRGITMMGYSPLLGGSYSREDKTVPPHYLSENSTQRQKTLEKIAGELNVSPNVVVLAWMLQHAPTVIPIVAASNQQQMDENLSALNLCFSMEQMNELDRDPFEGETY